MSRGRLGATLAASSACAPQAETITINANAFPPPRHDMMLTPYAERSLRDLEPSSETYDQRRGLADPATGAPAAVVYLDQVVIDPHDFLATIEYAGCCEASCMFVCAISQSSCDSGTSYYRTRCRQTFGVTPTSRLKIRVK
ncbi:hypothetical protein MSC49_28630 [Methylosinus sp. C49]|uniref:hypothetical protein n=1 Tax=Methylosinus sp. C49 TaxID=2699395 RepID=UPI0013669F88|nr:hypothetical protein [Methylosinus sp. C49]BBU62928.1 hypothetical protein MSC49_28630 [Methylosinus sp. C49]